MLKELDTYQSTKVFPIYYTPKPSRVPMDGRCPKLDWTIDNQGRVKCPGSQLVQGRVEAEGKKFRVTSDTWAVNALAASEYAAVLCLAHHFHGGQPKIECASRELFTN